MPCCHLLRGLKTSLYEHGTLCFSVPSDFFSSSQFTLLSSHFTPHSSFLKQISSERIVYRFDNMLKYFQFQVWQVQRAWQVAVKSLKVGMENVLQVCFCQTVFSDAWNKRFRVQTENRETLRDSPFAVRIFHSGLLRLKTQHGAAAVSAS